MSQNSRNMKTKLEEKHGKTLPGDVEPRSQSLMMMLIFYNRVHPDNYVEESAHYTRVIRSTILGAFFFSVYSIFVILKKGQKTTLARQRVSVD